MQLLMNQRIVSGLLGLLCAVSLATQDKKPPPPPPAAADDVPGLLKKLQASLGDAKKDSESRDTIDKIVAGIAKMDAKTRTASARALGNVFQSKRPHEACEIYTSAVHALAQMGADGAAELRKVIDTKPFKSEKEWQTFRALAVESLGKTKDQGSVKFLQDLFKDKYDPIIAAAGKACGHFGEAPQTVRKDIVGEMVKNLESIYNQSKASVDPNDIQQKRFQETYTAIQDPWFSTLKTLTGQELRDPTEWTKWWNKSKSKPWPGK
jgi:HEAT repeat protein